MEKIIKIVVGLHLSMEFLMEAINNKNLIVYAFEPNPKIVEKYKNNFIPNNYKIIQKAVSNKNGIYPFYICSESSCSSLNYWGNGPKLGEMEKIEVECITMLDFVKENNINEIQYISIDTQGSDLDVMKGFGEMFNIIQSGMCESLSEDTKWSLYENQPTYKEYIKFLNDWGYNTKWTYNFGGAIERNEVNIQFDKKVKNKII